MSTVRNRAKEQLPSVLLTLMSIIQALALEFLWDLVRTTERALDFDTVMTWVQIVANMLGIVQVWLLYTSATMRIRWTPSIRDLVIPFLIGILEFTWIDLTGPDHVPLWLWTFASVYLVAWWDAQSVFSRARQDPANAEFFTQFRAAGRMDLLEGFAVVGALIVLGLAILSSGARWLVVAGVLFTCAILVYRTDLARRYWDRSMTIGDSDPAEFRDEDGRSDSRG